MKRTRPASLRLTPKTFRVGTEDRKKIRAWASRFKLSESEWIRLRSTTVEAFPQAVNAESV